MPFATHHRANALKRLYILVLQRGLVLKYVPI